MRPDHGAISGPTSAWEAGTHGIPRKIRKGYTMRPSARAGSPVGDARSGNRSGGKSRGCKGKSKANSGGRI